MPRPWALPPWPRQSAQGDPPDLRPLVLEGLVVVELPAHHVRVEARAADVLADAVDHEHVDLLERQPRHQPLGQREQIRVRGPRTPRAAPPRSAPSGRRRSRRWPARPGYGIARALRRPRCERSDRSCNPGPRGDRSCPLALAQPDQEHLHQPAFDLSEQKPVCGFTRLQTST